MFDMYSVVLVWFRADLQPEYLLSRQTTCEVSVTSRNVEIPLLFVPQERHSPDPPVLRDVVSPSLARQSLARNVPVGLNPASFVQANHVNDNVCNV